MRVYVDVLLDILKDVKQAVTKNIKTIAVFLQILFPVFVVYTRIDYKYVFFWSLLYVFFYFYLIKLNQIKNNETKNGMPLPPYKLTETDNHGFVELVKGREEVAIIYLSDLEEYLEKTGKLKITVDNKNKN